MQLIISSPRNNTQALLRNCALYLLGSIAAGSAPQALAWWDLGHSAVCEAALMQVTQETRQKVEELLAVESPERMLKPESFGQACSWADRIKPKRRETAPWHYLNVPPNMASVEALSRPSEGDALTVFQEQLEQLENRSASIDVRAEALRWVGHLLGDLHQPMHLGYARDWGGNKYRLALPEHTRELLHEQDRQSTNMHAVWDGYLLIFASRTRGQSILDLATPQQGEQMENGLSHLATKLNPVQWANESLEILNSEATAYATTRVSSLDTPYLETNSDIAIDRIRVAATRLANILEDALAED